MHTASDKCIRGAKIAYKKLFMHTASKNCIRGAFYAYKNSEKCIQRVLFAYKKHFLRFLEHYFAFSAVGHFCGSIPPSRARFCVLERWTTFHSQTEIGAGVVAAPKKQLMIVNNWIIVDLVGPKAPVLRKIPFCLFSKKPKLVRGVSFCLVEGKSLLLRRSLII